MYTFVVTLHVILCLLLVIVVLMQPGKGADISSAFGGGASSQLFGASGPGNFLTKGTGTLAALFMVTSVVLALYSKQGLETGGVEDAIQKLQDQAPAAAPAAPVPAVPPAEVAPAPEPAPETPPTDPGAAPVEAPEGAPDAPPPTP